MNLILSNFLLARATRLVEMSNPAGYALLASQNPYPTIVYYWSILWPITDPVLVIFWAKYFLTLKVPKKCHPILVTLSLNYLKWQPAHYTQ